MTLMLFSGAYGKMIHEKNLIDYFTHPRSWIRGQKGTGSRTWIRNTVYMFCTLVLNKCPKVGGLQISSANCKSSNLQT
jgi:hypothetical protein